MIAMYARGLHEARNIQVLYLLAASRSLWHLLFQTCTVSKAGDMPQARLSPKPA